MLWLRARHARAALSGRFLWLSHFDDTTCSIIVPWDTNPHRGSSPSRFISNVRDERHEDDVESLKSTHHHAGRLGARMLDFALSPAQARTSFQAWQSQHWLAPSSLLKDPQRYTLQPTLLPFWLFEATVDTQYAGMVGIHDTQPQRSAWRSAPRRQHSWAEQHMQVDGALTAARPMPDDVGALELPPGTVVQAADVRQAIAWEFALRAMRERETVRATELLQAHVGPACSVKDVRVRMTVIQRRTRLLYFPAYTLCYEFGITLNESGERRAQHFQALVGAAAGASVAGERHWCPLKSQAAAAGTLGILGATTTFAAVPFATMVHDPWQLLTVDLAVGMMLAATAAGVMSRLAPHLARSRAEEQRLADEAAEFESIVSNGPLASALALDEDLATAQCVAEWRRWEESDVWRWDERRRRVWAERLWREQQRRRLQRAAWRARQAKEAAQREYEASREARRRQRHGKSRHEEAFAYTASGGRRVDWLGYYRLLGLDATNSAAISAAEVKDAFRQAALRWHPDRLKHASQAEMARAQSRFHQVTEAYNVLKDPELKRNYDRGA